MKKFEICYAIDHKSILIPSLLPVEEPDFEFPTSGVVSVILDYDFLPKSVVSRFIVRSHSDIEGDLKWRTGVVLANNSLNARALVRADDEEARIYVRCSGERRKEYMAIILHILGDINSSYREINCVERVPMPDNAHVTVSLSHLRRLEEMGEKEYLPDGASHKYQIGELLGEIGNHESKEDLIISMLENLAEKGDTVRA